MILTVKIRKYLDEYNLERKLPIMVNTSLITKEDALVLQNSHGEPCDYLVSAACGAIAGLIDIFLVGTPNESIIGKWTDAKTNQVVIKFARTNGWKPRVGNENNVNSAIGYLERNFKVNYDQKSSTDVDNLFKMNTKNHHIKSLGHSPDIIGLFFSLLNQFTGTSSFISDGKLITINTNEFELHGNNLISKFYCGVANWFGHILSDVAGSSGAVNRGSGVAIPFYEVFQFCKFGKFQINKDRQDFATLAIRVFQEGYDARFGAAMSIPVILCDLSIRLIWSIKHYFKLNRPLHECIPSLKNMDLREMLLFGHGTLCLFDGADAVIHSGGNCMLFFTRMNLIAWVRFTSLVLKEICIRTGIVRPLQKQLDAYKMLLNYIQAYYAQLEEIDIDRFRKETREYNEWTLCIEQAENDYELNIILKKTMIDMGIELPWDGEFDAFICNKNAHLVFQ